MIFLRKNPISGSPIHFTIITVLASLAFIAKGFCQEISSLSALTEKIKQHIQQPRFAGATWGIKIISLETGCTVFTHNAEQYFIPASNTKLYTAALALDSLGPDYQIPTTLYGTGPLENGVLKGDLILYGRGDPTLGVKDENIIQKPFDQLFSQLKQKGIQRVTGHLIINRDEFIGPDIGPSWETGDLAWSYGSEVSALNFQENAITLFVKPNTQIGQACQLTYNTDSINAIDNPIIINRTTTVPNIDQSTELRVYRRPGSHYLYLFGQLSVLEEPRKLMLAPSNPLKLVFRTLKSDLENHKIIIDKGLITYRLPSLKGDTPASHWIKLGEIKSPPLSKILQRGIKDSKNLYTQALLLQVGKHTSQITPLRSCYLNGGLTCTTEQWGVYALKQFLGKMKLASNKVHLEEGAGLSRRNLVTPTAIIHLLQYMDKQNNHLTKIFKESLAIAGRDGTLINRMKGTAAENNVRAKTGFLQHTHNLSGYVTTHANEKLAFSILLNNYPNPESDSLPNNKEIYLSKIRDVDDIAIMLAEFSGHT